MKTARLTVAARHAERRHPVRVRLLSCCLAVALTFGVGMPGAAQDDAQFDISVESVAELSGLTAVVAHSDGGANLRAEPGYDGEVIGTVSDGTAVELRIDEVDTVFDPDGTTRWWPVRVDGQDGWIAGFYLTDGASDASAAEAPSDETAAEEVTDAEAATDLPEATFDIAVDGVDDLSGLTARVVDGVNLRAEPSLDAEILLTIPADAVVSLRVDEADTVSDEVTRWWPVSYDGQAGWVSGAYLTSSSASAPADTADDASRDPALFAAGDYVAAQTDSERGVNIRADASPDAERVGYIAEADVVQVMDGPFYDDSGNGWYLVTDGGVTGFSDGDLLVAAPPPSALDEETAAAEVDAASVSFDEARFGAGDLAAAETDTGTGLNIRSGPSPDASRVGTIPESDVVEILDAPSYDETGNAWYLVSYGGTTGYSDGDFLVAADAPSVAAPVAQQGPTGSFIIPTNGVITQYYGCSPYAFEPYDANLGCNFHNGVDYANSAYTPIWAADGGVVTFAGWCNCGLGFMVTIDHGNGVETTYGHMAEQPYVSAGQSVNQGDVIGPMGSTGNSTGPHVHFMISISGSTVDPLGYV